MLLRNEIRLDVDFRRLHLHIFVIEVGLIAPVTSACKSNQFIAAMRFASCDLTRSKNQIYANN